MMETKTSSVMPYRSEKWTFIILNSFSKFLGRYAKMTQTPEVMIICEIKVYVTYHHHLCDITRCG